MKKLRWQILIVFLALIAIVVLLLGRQPVIQAETPQPVTGGIYTEGIIGEMGRLNPMFDHRNPADRDINRLLYSSLIRYNSEGLPQPELAESWGINQDRTEYNFLLREDLVWHDGEPVTTDDVVFTIELLQDPAFPIFEDQRALWEAVEVIPQSEVQMQFKLPEPYAPFLDYLTFGVLPAHLLGGLRADEIMESDFNLRPIGSGPYRFDRYLTDDGEITGVVLNANEDYYDQRPFIDQIVFRYFPDSQSALAAYQRGEIMGLSQIEPSILPEALAEPALNLYTVRLPQFSLIYLNLDNNSVPFFQNVQVRQALLYGLNRQWLIDRILDGQAILANGPLVPGTWAYFDGLNEYAYDPDRAMSILKAEDFTIPAEGGAVRENEDGPLAFSMAYPDDPLHTELALAVQEQWARVGVDVSLEAVPLEVLISDYLEAGNYEAALVDLNLSGFPDPDPYPLWHQAQITNGQNYAQWDDRPASEYLEQARIIVELDERARLYRNFQVRFSRELPALPLFYPVYTYGVAEEVQGISLGPLFDPSDRFLTANEWYLLARVTLEDVVTPTVTN